MEKTKPLIFRQDGLREDNLHTSAASGGYQQRQHFSEIKSSQLYEETRVMLISWVYQCVNLTDDT